MRRITPIMKATCLLLALALPWLAACSSGESGNFPPTLQTATMQPPVYAIERLGGTTTVYPPRGPSQIVTSGPVGDPVELGSAGSGNGSLQSRLLMPDDAGPADMPPESSLERGARFINETSREALALLGRDGISVDDKRQRLHALAKDKFWIASIARFAIKDHWDTVALGPRGDYVDLFHDVVVTEGWLTVLGRGSGDPTVDVVGLSAVPATDRDAVIIHSRIRGPDDRITEADWLVVDMGEGYRILDIVVSGSSLRQQRRDEFAEFFGPNGGGIDALIARLRTQTSRTTGR